MRVSGQCHAHDALPPGKGTRYPSYRWLGRPQGRSGHSRKICALYNSVRGDGRGKSRRSSDFWSNCCLGFQCQTTDQTFVITAQGRNAMSPVRSCRYIPDISLRRTVIQISQLQVCYVCYIDFPYRRECEQRDTMRGLDLGWLLWYCNCLQCEMRVLVCHNLPCVLFPSRMEIPKQFCVMGTCNDVVRGYVAAADSAALHKRLHITKRVTYFISLSFIQSSVR
jgi:hypothetical protein